MLGDYSILNKVINMQRRTSFAQVVVDDAVKMIYSHIFNSCSRFANSMVSLNGWKNLNAHITHRERDTNHQPIFYGFQWLK